MESERALYRYWIALIASLGGLLQSYVICVIAGALLFITAEFQLTPFQQGHIASFIILGAITGSLLSGALADRIGRRYTMILAAFIYLMTALSSILISSFMWLKVLRFVTGLAVGISAITVPVYLAEIAPPSKRGALVSCFQLFITMGTLVAYLVGFGAAKYEDWKTMFFLAAFPAALQLIGLFFFPESPRWLFSRGKTEEAKKVVEKIGGDFLAMTCSISTRKQEGLFSSKFSFLLLIGFVLSVFQQFSGINAIIYFTPQIFREAGIHEPQDAIFATVFVGIVDVCAALLTVLFIDRFGRRRLLLFSQAGVIVTLAVLILSFEADGYWMRLIAVADVVLYVFFFSLGFGPIVWVLISELFPISVRTKALGLFTFLSWAGTYVVVLTFPSLLSLLGSSWTFSLYALLSLGGLLFCASYVPETKGKSLEELEKIFSMPQKAK